MESRVPETPLQELSCLTNLETPATATAAPATYPGGAFPSFESWDTAQSPFAMNHAPPPGFQPNHPGQHDYMPQHARPHPGQYYTPHHAYARPPHPGQFYTPHPPHHAHYQNQPGRWQQPGQHYQLPPGYPQPPYQPTYHNFDEPAPGLDRLPSTSSSTDEIEGITLIGEDEENQSSDENEQPDKENEQPDKENEQPDEGEEEGAPVTVTAKKTGKAKKRASTASNANPSVRSFPFQSIFVHSILRQPCV